MIWSLDLFSWLLSLCIEQFSTLLEDNLSPPGDAGLLGVLGFRGSGKAECPGT